MLETDDCLDLGERNAGEAIRGDPRGEGESREENRRSKGWRDVGRWARRPVYDAGTLLPGEESPEPLSSQKSHVYLTYSMRLLE